MREALAELQAQAVPHFALAGQSLLQRRDVRLQLGHIASRPFLHGHGRFRGGGAWAIRTSSRSTVRRSRADTAAADLARSPLPAGVARAFVEVSRLGRRRASSLPLPGGGEHVRSALHHGHTGRSSSPSSHRLQTGQYSGASSALRLIVAFSSLWRAGPICSGRFPRRGLRSSATDFRSRGTGRSPPTAFRSPYISPTARDRADSSIVPEWHRQTRRRASANASVRPTATVRTSTMTPITPMVEAATGPSTATTVGFTVPAAPARPRPAPWRPPGRHESIHPTVGDASVRRILTMAFASVVAQHRQDVPGRGRAPRVRGKMRGEVSH